ncbi:MAG TPA: hypothetical protein VG796_23365 [Verrucomicrobiales bacterium]|jgi:hypothetical protein|nr:hypothetical protein [Verrucomicrobiales bacterium]
MHSEQQFTVTSPDTEPSICLDLMKGRLHFELAPNTSPERAQEIADYLNLVIQDVSFSRTESIVPDLERLNEEQPISEAVTHV